MKRRWCSGIMQDSHSCDPGSIPGRRNYLFYLIISFQSTRLIFMEGIVLYSYLECHLSL